MYLNYSINDSLAAVTESIFMSNLSG